MLCRMIQIFGTTKSRDTQRAVRFFKERRVPFQFIDLSEKAMSKGELDSVSRFIPLEKLIDPESAAYKKQGLAWQEFDPAEKLLACPLLFAMPVVRDKNRATTGLAEEEWKEWLKG